MQHAHSSKPRTRRRTPAPRTAEMSKRGLWIVVLLLVWMLAIVGRLAWLQLVKHGYYADKAQQNRVKDARLMAARGTIVDRLGKELAVTMLTDSVFVDQNQLKTDEERRRAANSLSSLLGTGESDLLKKMTGEDGFVWLKRKLEPEQSQAVIEAVEKQKLPGIAIRQEPQRIYPMDSLAAHLLGYVGAEEKGEVKGQAGLEQRFNEHLTGKTGEIRWEKDASGRAYGRSVTPAENGATITTTIDATLQHKVEVLLDEAMRTSRAKGASAIVLNPANGEILAMANMPYFNPNERPKSAEGRHRQNRAVSWPYEPGSVFKMVTYAAAIEEGLAKPDDKVNCGNGEITIGKRVIHDTHAYGVLSVADAFAKSSNVGAIRLAQRVGREKLFEYIGRFGFGRRTGIELPGESRGIVNPLGDWRADSIGSVAIGQEISVTLLQAVAAMGALANGGVWVQPHVVKQVVTPSNRVLYSAAPETRQVVKPETAAVMSGLLERVVTHGTARHAIQLAGYTAAGKTGTPQKAVGRGYGAGKFMPTFAGFVPVQNPRFAIIVMVDEPVGLHQGGSVAAPVFNLIAEAALGDYAVPPDDKRFRESLAAISKKYEAGAPGDAPEPGPIELEVAPRQTMPAPTPAGKAIALAVAKPKVEVSANVPRAPAKPPPLPPPASRPFQPEGETYVMPDLRGRGVRAVMQACVQMQLEARLIGSGIAKRQFPAAGARVRAGDTCKVEFE
jgi:cell division protein FtsI/penicillin-binding protein 2